MRIVHVITRLIIGGAQENTLHTVEDLVELFGDDVTLITGPAEGPEGDLFDRARQRSLDVRVTPKLRRALSPRVDASAYRELVGMIDELAPEVVHTHSSKAGILGRAAAYRCKVPAVVHTIHGLPFHPYERRWRNWLYIAAERWAARRCDRIISVAEAMTEQSLAAGVGRPEQYTTIYSGMDVEPFLHPTRSRAAVRAELGIPADAIVVGKVARLFELKGHDDVIAAAEQLVQRYPKVLFLFVGGGIWRDRLEAKIRAAGLTSHFVFAGLVPPARIPELLGAVDLVVHASYREGLARVLPQALIAGKPIVSYDVDGAREVVLPGQTGYLARPGDSSDLAQGLATLIGDASRRQAFGQTGRERFTEQFRHERMAQRIRQVYEEILAGRGR